LPKISLVAFDLDGTVLDSVRRTISPRVQAALARAHDAGTLTCVVSGRPVHMVGPALLEAPWLDWLITVNGAVITRASNREVLVRRPMPHALALDVIDSVRDLDVAWNAFLPSATFYEEDCFSYLAGDMEGGERTSTGAQTPEQMRRVLTDVDFVESIRPILTDRGDDVDKLGCSFPTAQGSRLAEGLFRARGDLEVARMGALELEVTLAGVTKGSAVDLLSDRLGLDEAAAVAFGDSGNDVSMTGRDYTFVAMGNATDQVKAAADEVCPTIQQDGVAQWLEAHL
jgi:Cof subfamily protein (haloacid dehalogenase superfamily)